MNTRRKPPARNRCTAVEEAWGPHPGCAEFMDGPEAVWQCPRPATHTVKYVEPPYLGGGAARERQCTWHARRSAGWGDRIYRFRRDPNTGRIHHGHR